MAWFRFGAERWAMCVYYAVFLVFWSIGCTRLPREELKFVDEVSIDGGQHVDDDPILSGLAHHPIRGFFVRTPAVYRPGLIDDDRVRIRVYYHRQGYFAVEVPEPEVSLQGREVTIVYRVREGPRFAVRRIEVDSLENSGIRSGEYLSLRSGKGFDYDDFEQDIQRLRGALRRASYYDADVDGSVEVDLEQRAVDVRYRVKPGRKKTIHHVTAAGQFLPKDSIDARIQPLSGRPYNPSMIQTAEGRLYELDLISSVSFDIDSSPTTDGLDVEVQLGQALQNELKFGAGVLADSSNTVLRGRANYLRRDFFHPLNSLRVDLRPEYFVEAQRPGFAGSIDIVRDDVFGVLRSQLTYGVAYGLTQYEGFSSLSVSARTFFDKPLLDDRLNLRIAPALTSYSVSIDSDELEDSSLVDEAGLEGTFFAQLRVEANFDARDNALSPKSGWFGSMAVEAGQVFDDDQSSFVVIAPRLSGYLSVGTPRVVGALRLSGAANLGGSPLPLPSRLFGGGAGGHRGFARRELSPGVTDSSGDYTPVGGEISVLGSAELRVDLVKVFERWAGIVAFADLGDVGLKTEDLLLDPPHVAVGGGVRVDTPVGPVRLDFGYRINRTGALEPAPNSRWAFHLAIGEAF
ncbi:MAG: BamA/TamA family outer membrane protein [Myxococcota bacterium]